MSGYVKRTCSECGYRDIQPNMVCVTKRVEVGRGDSKVDGMTLIGGILLENRKSQKKIRDTLWSNNRRVYTREKTMWLCKSCDDASSSKKPTLTLKSTEKTAFDRTLDKFIIIASILFMTIMSCAVLYAFIVG